MKRFLTALIAVLLFASVAWAVDVRDFREKGDHGWGPAIRRGLAELKDDNPRWPDTSGGELHFGLGRYPVYDDGEPIIIDIPVTIKGETAAPYACSIEWKGTDPDAALFTFKRHDWDADVRFSNIEIRSANKAGVPFRFDSKDQYTRGYRFDNVTIVRFAKAFEVTGGGKQKWWGNLTCTDCTIHYCGAVIDATAGQFNEVRFTRCTMSKHGLASEGWAPQYAFRFRGGDNIGFYGCNFEASPRVFRVDRVNGLQLINNCRMEGNATSADPPIHITNSRNIDLQIYNRALKIEERPDAPPTVLLEDCKDSFACQRMWQIYKAVSSGGTGEGDYQLLAAAYLQKSSRHCKEIANKAINTYCKFQNEAIGKKGQEQAR